MSTSIPNWPEAPQCNNVESHASSGYFNPLSSVTHCLNALLGPSVSLIVLYPLVCRSEDLFFKNCKGITIDRDSLSLTSVPHSRPNKPLVHDAPCFFAYGRSRVIEIREFMANLAGRECTAVIFRSTIFSCRILYRTLSETYEMTSKTLLIKPDKQQV